MQRSGTYLNWEGRATSFGPALDASGVLPDCRVLDDLVPRPARWTRCAATACGRIARSAAVASAAPICATTTRLEVAAVFISWRSTRNPG